MPCSPGGMVSEGELLWVLPGKLFSAKMTIDSSTLVNGVTQSQLSVELKWTASDALLLGYKTHSLHICFSHSKADTQACCVHIQKPACISTLQMYYRVIITLCSNLLSPLFYVTAVYLLVWYANKCCQLLICTSDKLLAKFTTEHL